MSALEIAAATGSRADKQRIVELALAENPASVAFRREALHWLQPKWGGSWELLEALVHDAQQHAVANPRVRWLRGHLGQDPGSGHVDPLVERSRRRSRAIDSPVARSRR